MNFKEHYNLKGLHAFLSPSQYHWIRYDDEKLHNRIITSEAAKRGSEYHELAKDCIRLGVRLPKNSKTLNAYVNDAIQFRMTPEQVLYATEHCFGTADAISFEEKTKTLRIFDLKTGETACKVDQLLVYAAIYCIEYAYRPFDLNYDLRIYQSDQVAMFEIDPADIAHIMDRIITFSKYIDKVREEVGA